MAMSSTQIRHKNFKKLFDDFVGQHPDLPQRGMLKLFAQRLNLSDRYLSHIKCNRKNIGNQIARAIEEQLNLPHGWMDREHDTFRMPTSDTEKLFVETALTLFRSQPNEARELMIDMLRQRLNNPLAGATTQAVIETPGKTPATSTTGFSIATPSDISALQLPSEQTT